MIHRRRWSDTENGSDATTGVVRIARHATGKDHVIGCGYHGWQDWYIGGTPRTAAYRRRSEN